jgi:hypothetical protein
MESERPTAAAPEAAPASESAEARRRLAESVILALVTSTGLYLVGSVYADAYYGRMSIEFTSLDLPPTYVGLQSMHMLQSLLAYPSTVLFWYALARLLSSRTGWARSWYDRARHRFERSVLLVTNLIVIAPLVADAVRHVVERPNPDGTVVSEVSAFLTNVVFVLVVYVLWLSLGSRATIISQIRQRKVIPIGLVGTAYLIGALIATTYSGAQAAEFFMLGISDASLAVEFTMRDELPPVDTDAELLLVAARNGNYFVVERQSFPPDPRPSSFIIPFASVEVAHMRRVTDAGLELVDFRNPQLRGEATSIPP